MLGEWIVLDAMFSKVFVQWEIIGTRRSGRSVNAHLSSLDLLSILPKFLACKLRANPHKKPDLIWKERESREYSTQEITIYIFEVYKFQNII